MRWHTEEGHDVPNRDPIFGLSPSVPSEPLSRGPTEAFGSHILPRVFRVPNHTEYFPIGGGPGATNVVPFVLPPAYDKLLGYDAILDLWENLHRTLDAFSSIVVIGYSMPSYDSYAYEALGRLFVNYQRGGDTTSWEQRRVPIQLEVVSKIPQHDFDASESDHTQEIVDVVLVAGNQAAKQLQPSEQTLDCPAPPIAA